MTLIFLFLRQSSPSPQQHLGYGSNKPTSLFDDGAEFRVDSAEDRGGDSIIGKRWDVLNGKCTIVATIIGVISLDVECRGIGNIVQSANEGAERSLSYWGRGSHGL
jgi:hypothetical protein